LEPGACLPYYACKIGTEDTREPEPGDHPRISPLVLMLRSGAQVRATYSTKAMRARTVNCRLFGK